MGNEIVVDLFKFTNITPLIYLKKIYTAFLLGNYNCASQGI